jgi:catalase
MASANSAFTWSRVIGLSPDKMLLGRAFAYNDTQRHRIGANFH